jgi:hypothetical protein
LTLTACICKKPRTLPGSGLPIATQTEFGFGFFRTGTIFIFGRGEGTLLINCINKNENWFWKDEQCLRKEHCSSNTNPRVVNRFSYLTGVDYKFY